MKRVIGYKNYICFILALAMIITGIYLYETQMDSSFVLRMQEPSAVTLDEMSAFQQDTLYTTEESNPQEVVNSKGTRSVLYRAFRCGRTYEDMQIEEKQYAIIHFIQELDMRLCRTDNLTQVFNVLYIHHQDGVKGAGLFV